MQCKITNIVLKAQKNKYTNLYNTRKAMSVHEFHPIYKFAEKKYNVK